MKQKLITVLSCSILFTFYFSYGQLDELKKSTLKAKAMLQVAEGTILPGALHTEKYVPMLKNKTIAIVANQTSLINKTHLVDSLKSLKIKIKCVFAPEHGFRGDTEAGGDITSTIDAKTKLPVISIYGKKNKPSPEDLKGVDYVVFDIQDVGARFFTYISTLEYVMDACAENKVKLIVLDRPNPNGFYVDGPVLDKNFRSFVGRQSVPIVYGLTIGEYAMMLNGENWLDCKKKCDLTVIECSNYDHSKLYSLPVPPSPNLPNMNAIYLYPSLCLFEGTGVSVGRGTDKPFQIIGTPDSTIKGYMFTPKKISHVAENPPFENQKCYGMDLTKSATSILSLKKIELKWLIGFYRNNNNQSKFFNSFFDKLAGTDQLRIMIQTDKPETEIRKSWETDLKTYKAIRKKYLLYLDFE
ncbi:MAG: DUF1343 domain-containing protein [Bacteroidia bacterium]